MLKIRWLIVMDAAQGHGGGNAWLLEISTVERQFDKKIKAIPCYAKHEAHTPEFSMRPSRDSRRLFNFLKVVRSESGSASKHLKRKMKFTGDIETLRLNGKKRGDLRRSSLIPI